MSDKRATLRERTQRFRRRMRGQKAVSPVVATLILILIAVAAAAALYLWLVAWQGNITGGIGNQQVQATFTIGGSTSVYPFSSLAVSWYEQNHSDVVIQDSQGGTGAGMLAVCAGHVDVGAASSLETVTGLQTSDGCPSTPGITITTIAYDAVDVIVPAADPHGLVSVSYDTMAYIYATQTTGSTPTLVPTTINGVGIALGSVTAGKLAWDQIPAAVSGGTVGVLPAETNLATDYYTVPTTALTAVTPVPASYANVNSTTAHLYGNATFALSDANSTTAYPVINASLAVPIVVNGGAANGTATKTSLTVISQTVTGASDKVAYLALYSVTGAHGKLLTNLTAGPASASENYTYSASAPIQVAAKTGSACGPGNANLCANATSVLHPTAQSTCGWSICAGGSATIDTVARSDASGTTQSFEARILGATSATAFASTFAGLGFSGCGGNNLLSDCGYVAVKTGNGNPGVISAVAGDPNAIGYASDGLARATTSGVTCQGVSTAACGIGLESPGQSAAVLPSLGATGSVAGGIVNGGFGTPGLTTKLTVAQSYAGSRPFEFVTLQPPAGEVYDFIQYIVDPNNNQALASATGEVSLYTI